MADHCRRIVRRHRAVAVKAAAPGIDSKLSDLAELVAARGLQGGASDQRFVVSRVVVVSAHRSMRGLRREKVSPKLNSGNILVKITHRSMSARVPALAVAVKHWEDGI